MAGKFDGLRPPSVSVEPQPEIASQQEPKPGASQAKHSDLGGYGVTNEKTEAFANEFTKRLKSTGPSDAVGPIETIKTRGVERVGATSSTQPLGGYQVRPYRRADFISGFGKDLPSGMSCNSSIVKYRGQEKVLKDFCQRKEVQFATHTPEKNPRLNRKGQEVGQLYLKEDVKDVIQGPSHIICDVIAKGGQRSTVVVEETSDKGFRAWVKSEITKGNSIIILGTLQDVLPGEDLLEAVQAASAGETLDIRNNLSTFLLKSLRTLAKHGFIHTDIKLENMMYDKAKHSFKLIDTGTLRKLTKHPPKENARKFNESKKTAFGYTIPHPAINKSGGTAGFADDMFAAGVAIFDTDTVSQPHFRKLILPLRMPFISITREDAQNVLTVAKERSAKFGNPPALKIAIALMEKSLNYSNENPLIDREQYIQILNEIELQSKS